MRQLVFSFSLAESALAFDPFQDLLRQRHRPSLDQRRRRRRLSVDRQPLNLFQTPLQIRSIDLARQHRGLNLSPERRCPPPGIRSFARSPGSSAPARFVAPPTSARSGTARPRSFPRRTTPNFRASLSESDVEFVIHRPLRPAILKFPLQPRLLVVELRHLRNHRRHVRAEQLPRVAPNCNITPIGDLCRAA